MKPLLPYLRLEEQRGRGDCTIVCLAMLTGVTYEDALTASTKHAHRRGMHLGQIIEAAAELGVTLRRKRRIDWEVDTGIVSCECRANRHGTSHAVVLRWSLIFDTEGVVWEPETFRTYYRVKWGQILVRDE